MIQWLLLLLLMLLLQILLLTIFNGDASQHGSLDLEHGTIARLRRLFGFVDDQLCTAALDTTGFRENYRTTATTFEMDTTRIVVRHNG